MVWVEGAPPHPDPPPTPLSPPSPPPPGAMSAAGRAREPEAEMPATEKDLADDAPWKRIQQNTFTRWCNEHLKCVQKRVGNLQTDLGDGLRLIALLEVLSQKKLGRRYNARPTFRQMQLENVSVALDFLERENIKLVSIGESWGALGRSWGGFEGRGGGECGAGVRLWARMGVLGGVWGFLRGFLRDYKGLRGGLRIPDGVIGGL